MRFSREQYIELKTFGRVERQMFVELFGPLVGLAQEWRAQGATEEEISLVAFDWDYVPLAHCGGHTGAMGGSEPKVIEDTPEYRLEKDCLGRTLKLFKKSATIPLPLDYPVKNMDDWRRIKRLFEFSAERVNYDEVAAARKAQAAGALVVAAMPGAFSTPRELMGDEQACLCYYDDPELMQDILQTLSHTTFRVLEMVSAEVVIDQLSVGEDLAGKSGPLVGPTQVREFIKPYYRKIWDLLASRGTLIFQMDSDGNLNAVIDEFLEAGLNALIPLEPAAGMDIVQLRKKYGKSLAVGGGIDKHVLRQGKAEIRKELEYKMQSLMRSGGTVFSLDHRIPNGTPLENYRYYVDTGRELLGLPPRDPLKKGWQRMAF
ncbi:MAG: hypothetical protein HYV35_01285 [Lentisphaerae bacterium]|nr:hypothetical protein [Lentisphaerota bacterium]